MSNHKAPARPCQYPPGPDARENTPPPLDGIDRRLVHRYGAWLLTGGYTALPTYAWVYYARLGVSEAEMVCLAQLCTYWWSARDPFPGEAALATRMGKSVRTIQGYLRSLEGKGLLHIHIRLSNNGRQSTNSYDLRPFFTSVEGLARLDGLLSAPDDDHAAPATPTADESARAAPTTGSGGGRYRTSIEAGQESPQPPCNEAAGNAERKSLCAGGGSAGPEHTATDDGRQSTNAYDLRPFFAAVEGLARLDGLLPADDAAPSIPAISDTDPCNDGPIDHTNRAQRDAEREPLCADATSVGTEKRPTDTGTPTMGEGEGSHAGGVKNPSPQVNPIEIENFDFDSIPPTPAQAAQTTSGNDTQLPASADPDDQALAAEIAALSTELGDDAPRSSLGRARNLCRDAGVSPPRFLRLLDEAAARTRDRQACIVKRRRDGQAPNGMPYLFAVLADLLHPAPPRTADVGPATDRRRAGPSGRRRRQRAGGRSEPINSYAAWSDSPARLPIVEEHPVWHAVLDELAQVMTVENFNAWLSTTRALDQDGDVLRVAVPAAFNKTWLEQKLAGKVAGALHKIDYNACGIGRVGRVEYVVAAAA